VYTAFIFNDNDILLSQNVLSLCQLSFAPIAISLSSLTLQGKTWLESGLVILLAGCCALFVFGLFMLGNLTDLILVSFIFALSILLGELSAIPRSFIFSSLQDRNDLIRYNLASSILRLGSFFVFLLFWPALHAFLLSGALSNFLRSFLTTALAYRIGFRLEMKRTKNIKKPSFAILWNLANYMERNPSPFLVFTIITLCPLAGHDVSFFAMSILLLTISFAISSVSWTLFEINKLLNSSMTLNFLLAVVSIPILGVVSLDFVPAAAFEAESFKSLRDNPFLLAYGPVVFGLSNWISVFAYGSKLALVRVPIFCLLFILLGVYAFILCGVMNLLLAGILGLRVKNIAQ
jgi:hypothetical protein